MSRDRSNTSQLYSRFNHGRNVNTSYLTNNAFTPTGAKESPFDFKDLGDKSEKSGQTSPVDMLSNNDMSGINISRDFVREQDPENAFS